MFIFVTELGITRFKDTGVQQKYNYGPVLDPQEAIVQDICLNVFYFSWEVGRNVFDKE